MECCLEFITTQDVRCLQNTCDYNFFLGSVSSTSNRRLVQFFSESFSGTFVGLTALFTFVGSSNVTYNVYILIEQSSRSYSAFPHISQLPDPFISILFVRIHMFISIDFWHISAIDIYKYNICCFTVFIKCSNTTFRFQNNPKNKRVSMSVISALLMLSPFCASLFRFNTLIFIVFRTSLRVCTILM